MAVERGRAAKRGSDKPMENAYREENSGVNSTGMEQPR